MAEPSDDRIATNRIIKKLFGFAPDDYISKDRCIPPPLGCGGMALEFVDDESREEYALSGMCQRCQDAFYGEFPYLKKPTLEETDIQRALDQISEDLNNSEQEG